MHGSNLGVLNAFLSEAFDELPDLREILLLSLALFSPSGCPTKRSYSLRWKQHIKSGKPTNFNTFFCNQVGVRGLRYDITRKPFNSTLSKGKKITTYLQGKILLCHIPLHLQIRINKIKFLLSAIFSKPRRFWKKLMCRLKKTKCLHLSKIHRVRKNSKSHPSGSTNQIKHVSAICTSILMTKSIL